MEWQPIETAPKDGTYVDLYVQALWFGRDAGRWRIADARWTGEEWESRHRYTGESLEYRSGGPDGKSSRLITHWMPIPKAPNAALTGAEGVRVEGTVMRI